MTSNSISITTLTALNGNVNWTKALQAASSAEGHMMTESYSGISDKGSAKKVAIKLPKKSQSPAEKLVLWLQHAEAMHNTWQVWLPVPSFVIDTWPSE